MQQGNFDDFPGDPDRRVGRNERLNRTSRRQHGAQRRERAGRAAFAPALINAIVAATAKRIRVLPIGKQLEALEER